MFSFTNIIKMSLTIVKKFYNKTGYFFDGTPFPLKRVTSTFNSVENESGLLLKIQHQLQNKICQMVHYLTYHALQQ